MSNELRQESNTGASDQIVIFQYQDLNILCLEKQVAGSKGLTWGRAKRNMSGCLQWLTKGNKLHTSPVNCLHIKKIHD